MHDHDMPVPKKRHGPPSASLVAAAAPASTNNVQLKKTGLLQNQETEAQCLEDTEGELTGVIQVYSNCLLMCTSIPYVRL